MGKETKVRFTLTTRRVRIDPKLFAELNVERYELAKTGKIHYSHPEGTHDDRFWALALAVYGTETITPRSKPVARTM